MWEGYAHAVEQNLLNGGVTPDYKPERCAATSLVRTWYQNSQVASEAQCLARVEHILLNAGLPPTQIETCGAVKGLVCLDLALVICPL